MVNVVYGGELMRHGGQTLMKKAKHTTHTNMSNAVTHLSSAHLFVLFYYAVIVLGLLTQGSINKRPLCGGALNPHLNCKCAASTRPCKRTHAHTHAYAEP